MKETEPKAPAENGGRSDDLSFLKIQRLTLTDTGGENYEIRITTSGIGPSEERPLTNHPSQLGILWSMGEFDQAKAYHSTAHTKNFVGFGAADVLKIIAGANGAAEKERGGVVLRKTPHPPLAGETNADVCNNYYINQIDLNRVGSNFQVTIAVAPLPGANLAFALSGIVATTSNNLPALLVTLAPAAGMPAPASASVLIPALALAGLQAHRIILHPNIPPFNPNDNNLFKSGMIRVL